MEESTIFREPSQIEKAEMVMIETGRKKKTIIEAFKEKAEAKEKEYLQEKKKPFCFRCARFDFLDNIQKNMTELERSASYETDIDKYKLKLPDLDQYAKEDRFELIKETIAMEPVPGLVSGRTVHRNIQIGAHRDFKCKVRGCGISIFISNDDLEKEKKK